MGIRDTEVGRDLMMQLMKQPTLLMASAAARRAALGIGP